jgi:hypothetical protein
VLVSGHLLRYRSSTSFFLRVSLFAAFAFSFRSFVSRTPHTPRHRSVTGCLELRCVLCVRTTTYDRHLARLSLRLCDRIAYCPRRAFHTLFIRFCASWISLGVVLSCRLCWFWTSGVYACFRLVVYDVFCVVLFAVRCVRSRGWLRLRDTTRAHGRF